MMFTDKIYPLSGRIYIQFNYFINIDDVIRSNCKEANSALLELNRNEFFLHLRL